MGLAPAPDEEMEALVQIYAARAFRWRGYFAVHTWIAAKEKNGTDYTIYQVTSFGLRRGGSTISVHKGIPDRRWYGAETELLFQLQGERAELAIPQIRKAVQSYPYPDFYRAWPGPNSNTFVSHIIRQTPQLRFELPPHAIGKDWIGKGEFFASSESGTGVQFSLFGLLGIIVGLGEGIEINVLGLSFGLDFLRPAIKLPLIGRLGMSDDEPPFGDHVQE